MTTKAGPASIAPEVGALRAEAQSAPMAAEAMAMPATTEAKRGPPKELEAAIDLRTTKTMVALVSHEGNTHKGSTDKVR